MRDGSEPVAQQQPQAQARARGIASRNESHLPPTIQDKKCRNARNAVVMRQLARGIGDGTERDTRLLQVTSDRFGIARLHGYGYDRVIFGKGVNGAFFRLAHRAPGGPKVDQRGLAPELAQIERFSVYGLGAEHRCGAARGIPGHEPFNGEDNHHYEQQLPKESRPSFRTQFPHFPVSAISLIWVYASSPGAAQVNIPAMSRPAVSIVLPFYNAESTLAETLESIAAQTFGEYELVAVDDGSRDASGRIVHEYARRDPRIRLLALSHSGVVNAMNAGVAASRAPIIARMDADDRMHPERLQRQKAWLDANPDIDLVGTQVRLFPEEAVQEGFQTYIRWQNACLSPEAIADEAYIELPIAHPTVMFRKGPIQALGGYRDGDFPEDYELILRLIHAGLRLSKVPQILLDWRESTGRLTRTDEHYSREAFDRVRAAYLLCDPRLHTSRPLAFWGAGRKSRRRADPLIGEGLRPAAWIDIDAAKIGKHYAGAPVVAPGWLARRDRPFVLSFVNNHGARARIAEHLESLGYLRGRDYLMVG